LIHNTQHQALATQELPVQGTVEYWDAYYAHSCSAPDQPSDFAQFIAGLLGAVPMRIVDIACGNGRDSIFFASKGHYVLGLDQSEAALELARAAAARHGLTNVDFAHFVVGCNRHLPTPNVGNVPLVLYARFFFHAIPEPVEDDFLNLIANLDGDQIYVAAEFRTINDPRMTYGEPISAHERLEGGSHYRRYIAPEHLIRKLETTGLRIIHHVEGFGLSAVKGDDPHLCRIVAVRG